MTTTHRITTTAAVILSLAAAGAPTATATTTTASQPPAGTYDRPDKSMIPITTPGSAPQAVVRVEIPPSGFDWADAGIGAAGGLAIAMIGLGGALVISQRPRRNRQTTPLS